MKPRGRISCRFAIWAGSVVALAMLFVAASIARREPVYHGRTVSQWITDVRPGIGFVAWGQDRTMLYLPSLAERDRKLVRLEDPRFIIADTNMTMTAEFSPNGAIVSAISNFIPRDRDTWEANQRIRELGAKAVPWAIGLLTEPRSGFETRYETLWGKLPKSLQRILPMPKPRPDANRRVQVAYCLGEIGPPARAALQVLQRALTDKTPWVRAAAYEAIRKIDPDARPVLAEAPFH